MTIQHLNRILMISVVCLVALIFTNLPVSANSSGCCRYTVTKPNKGLGTACVTVDAITCRSRFSGKHTAKKRCERATGTCEDCDDPRFDTLQASYAFFNLDTEAIAIGQELTSKTPAVDIHMNQVSDYDNLYITGCGEVSVEVQDIRGTLSFLDHPDPNLVGFAVEQYTLSLAPMTACDRFTGSTELSLIPGDQVYGTVDLATGNIWAEMTLQLHNDLAHPAVPSLIQHSISGSWDDDRQSIAYLSFGGPIIQTPGDFGTIVVSQTDDFTQVVEGGPSDRIQVALGGPIALPVMVQLEVNAEGLHVDHDTLMFTPENWSIPQGVTVSASDNGRADANPRFAVITLTSRGKEPVLAHQKRHIMTRIVDQKDSPVELDDNR